MTSGSVVVPAHDEAGVIGRCLAALLDGAPDDLDVVVVCNGCTDDTAARARAVDPRVRVVEIAEASKTAALRRGDALAAGFPRIYLDADVVLSGQAAGRVLDVLRSGAAPVARPRQVYVTDGCSWVVRRYFAARSRIPALMGAVWGAGVFGLSAQGRARFEDWPELTADDLFVDALFGRQEIAVLDDVAPVRVMAPRTTAALLRTRRRAEQGKTGVAAAVADEHARSRPDTASTVRGLVRTALRHPAGLVDAAVYAAVSVLARRTRAAGAPRERWERDETTRIPVGEAPSR